MTQFSHFNKIQSNQLFKQENGLAARFCCDNLQKEKTVALAFHCMRKTDIALRISASFLAFASIFFPFLLTFVAFSCSGNVEQ
jgi:hypothetical protein